ncbi:unnamed protein product [Ectocarpus sp. 8 AP-2014]
MGNIRKAASQTVRQTGRQRKKIGVLRTYSFLKGTPILVVRRAQLWRWNQLPSHRTTNSKAANHLVLLGKAAASLHALVTLFPCRHLFPHPFTYPSLALPPCSFQQVCSVTLKWRHEFVHASTYRWSLGCGPVKT